MALFAIGQRTIPQFKLAHGLFENASAEISDVSKCEIPASAYEPQSDFLHIFP